MSAGSHAAIDLTELSFKETLALFAKLDAPALSEMNGEYEAKLLSQPSLARHRHRPGHGQQPDRAWALVVQVLPPGRLESGPRLQHLPSTWGAPCSASRCRR